MLNCTVPFQYKYFLMSENKSVFNWTFCQLLTKKHNGMKIFFSISTHSLWRLKNFCRILGFKLIGQFV